MGFISSDSLVFGAFAIQFWSAFFWFCCGSSSSPLVLSADTEGDSLGCLVLLGHLLQRGVGRSHCACVSLCHWVGELVLLSSTSTTLVPTEAEPGPGCQPSELHLFITVWTFGSCCVVCWYSSLWSLPAYFLVLQTIAYEYKGFSWLGENNREGKNEEDDFKSHCFWALIWWQLLSLSIDSFISSSWLPCDIYYCYFSFYTLRKLACCRLSQKYVSRRLWFEWSLHALNKLLPSPCIKENWLYPELRVVDMYKYLTYTNENNCQMTIRLWSFFFSKICHVKISINLFEISITFHCFYLFNFY